MGALPTGIQRRFPMTALVLVLSEGDPFLGCLATVSDLLAASNISGIQRKLLQRLLARVQERTELLTEVYGGLEPSILIAQLRHVEAYVHDLEVALADLLDGSSSPGQIRKYTGLSEARSRELAAFSQWLLTGRRGERPLLRGALESRSSVE